MDGYISFTGYLGFIYFLYGEPENGYEFVAANLDVVTPINK